MAHWCVVQLSTLVLIHWCITDKVYRVHIRLLLIGSLEELTQGSGDGSLLAVLNGALVWEVPAGTLR